MNEKDQVYSRGGGNIRCYILFSNSNKDTQTQEKEGVYHFSSAYHIQARCMNTLSVASSLTAGKNGDSGPLSPINISDKTYLKISNKAKHFYLYNVWRLILIISKYCNYITVLEILENNDKNLLFSPCISKVSYNIISWFLKKEIYKNFGRKT